MRLIDAEALKRTTERLIKEQEQNGFYPKSWDEEVIAFKYLVDNMPAIEAKPVLHAHWEWVKIEDGDSYFELAKCSKCGALSARNEYPYCRNCGAQMDEKEGE